MTTLDAVIARPSIRDEALRRIRAAIIYGDIETGPIHSAPALAERMGVSVTPVREALIELTSRGMVEQVRNRGFRVVERTAAELDAELELRELLEIPLVARLAGQLDAAELEDFRGLVDDGIAAADDRDLGAFLDLDRRFHLGLLRRAGNPRAVDVVDRVHDHLRLATFRAAESGLAAVAREHGDILDALAEGGAGAVRKALARHLDRTRAAWH